MFRRGLIIGVGYDLIIYFGWIDWVELVPMRSRSNTRK